MCSRTEAASSVLTHDTRCLMHFASTDLTALISFACRYVQVRDRLRA